MPKPKGVVKIEPKTMVIVQTYRSARAASLDNYMSYPTVTDRCNGRIKGLIAPDGFIYKWKEDHDKLLGIEVRT